MLYSIYSTLARLAKVLNRYFLLGKPYFQGASVINTELAIVAGQATSIRCRYTPFPEIPFTILWYYTNNGLLLSTSSDGRIAIGTDGTAYFANLLVSDAAPYRCAVRPNEPTNTNVAYYSANTTLRITPRCK